MYWTLLQAQRGEAYTWDSKTSLITCCPLLLGTTHCRAVSVIQSSCVSVKLTNTVVFKIKLIVLNRRIMPISIWTLQKRLKHSFSVSFCLISSPRPSFLSDWSVWTLPSGRCSNTSCIHRSIWSRTTASFCVLSLFLFLPSCLFHVT